MASWAQPNPPPPHHPGARLTAPQRAGNTLQLPGDVDGGCCEHGIAIGSLRKVSSRGRAADAVHRRVADSLPSRASALLGGIPHALPRGSAGKIGLLRAQALSQCGRVGPTQTGHLHLAGWAGLEDRSHLIGKTWSDGKKLQHFLPLQYNRLRELHCSHGERAHHLVHHTEALYVNIVHSLRNTHCRPAVRICVRQKMSNLELTSHTKPSTDCQIPSRASEFLLSQNVHSRSENNLDDRVLMDRGEDPMLHDCRPVGGNQDLRSQPSGEFVQVPLLIAPQPPRGEHGLKIVDTPMLQGAVHAIRVHVRLERSQTFAQCGPLLTDLAKHGGHLGDAYRENRARHKHEPDGVEPLTGVDGVHFCWHGSHHPQRPIQTKEVLLVTWLVNPTEKFVLSPKLFAPFRSPMLLTVILVR
mmetsp:Transcript_33366/g.86632  ORF Transcript_33366/g.86632 Transcript_33366/m.86632 type:complete len:413 (+) Transcript_33366:135-1373(+)